MYINFWLRLYTNQLKYHFMLLVLLFWRLIDLDSSSAHTLLLYKSVAKKHEIKPWLCAVHLVCRPSYSWLSIPSFLLLSSYLTSFFKAFMRWRFKYSWGTLICFHRKQLWINTSLCLSTCLSFLLPLSIPLSFSWLSGCNICVVGVGTLAWEVLWSMRIDWLACGRCLCDWSPS